MKLPLRVGAGGGLKSVHVTIHGGSYGLRKFSFNNPAAWLQAAISWERKFGQVTAPVGEYRVTVAVRDRMGNNTSGQTVLVIPDPAAQVDPDLNALIPNTGQDETRLYAAEDDYLSLHRLIGNDPDAETGAGMPADPVSFSYGSGMTNSETITALPTPEQTTTTSAGLLWGAAALAAAAAAVAYGRERKRKREAALATARKHAGQHNAKASLASRLKRLWKRGLQRTQPIRNAILAAVAAVTIERLTRRKPDYGPEEDVLSLGQMLPRREQHASSHSPSREFRGDHHLLFPGCWHQFVFLDRWLGDEKIMYDSSIVLIAEMFFQDIILSDSLLTTKLFIPPTRLELVHRPRLVERLNAGLHRKLTLISAPAGFGKTTLVTEWLHNVRVDSKNKTQAKNKVAWLSLDAGDNDPVRFLSYFIAALNQIQGIDTAFGKMALSILQASHPPPPDAVLTSLINEFAEIPDKIILVLDDYHVIDSKPVDEALAFLLKHLPPQMHLVIATREDPHLPLARLRARGQLTELRAADLRFTPSEAAEFLNRVMSLNLSAEDITALEARTEGWIAGLQLAAISMQGHSDTTSFIRSFTGSHRFVLDYLAGEVLERQPGRVRNFLLQTAILDRLSGSLCDAVTAQDGGRGMLETLERGNLFVVPLDDQGQWYRYHHLFADVLQVHLIEAQPEQVSSLHQRASAWYEQNGLPPAAIRHALAAEDFERAAGMIELAWSAMDLSYQSSTWLGWVKALPDALIHARPVLSVGYAWALLDGGELEASEARLHDAERWLDTPTDEMVVVDKEQFRSLPASIAIARAYRSLAFGNVPGTVKYAQQALELTPEDDQARYIQATSLLGLAQYTSGDLQAAERSLADFHTNLRKNGEILTLIGITFLLADIRVALGRLNAAENSYQQSLRLAISQGEPMPLGTADLYRGLAELYVERGDMEAAAQHLLTSQKLGEQTALTDWTHRLYVSQARLKEAQGDLDGALALLDQAERVYIRGPLPDVRPVAALKARVWLKQGRLDEALLWAREQGLSVDDDIRYTREFEHITLARVLIAAGKSDREAGSLDEVARLLGRLLQAAETGGRLGSAIQILLLQALTFQAQDNFPQALAALERALALAEPEGYVRIFVDEGEAMRLLIEKQSRHRDHPLSGYADKLLAAFTQPAAAPKSAMIHQKSDLIEPLSERELEVLKLLRGELSGPEIAQQLIVSLNTFRTHTKNIYNKLGVNSRRAAIRRAGELDLF